MVKGYSCLIKLISSSNKWSSKSSSSGVPLLFFYGQYFNGCCAGKQHFLLAENGKKTSFTIKRLRRVLPYARKPAARFSPVDHCSFFGGCLEMDSREYFHFGGSTLDSGGTSNAGTSSMERGDQTQAQIKQKLVLDDVKRGMSAGNVELSGTGRHASISDLVWCKVIGQTWWPGKVIGDSIVLRKGDEYLANDSYLVVSFGNNSFEWYYARNVKPFWENFPQMAKRSNTATFREAVSCALEEVSRRVKYTLTCRCMPEWIYMDVGWPLRAVDAGSNEESSDDNVTEEVILSTASFVPWELVDYLQESSVSASDGDNRLLLEAAKAQLFALFFWRNRSRKLPVYASLFTEPAENNSPVDNRKKDDYMQDFVGQYKTPSSLSWGKEASVMGGYPDNVDFILSSPPSDKGKGELVNEPDNLLARGTKELLLKESGDGAGSHIGSTEIDLVKKTQSYSPVPNLENHAFAGAPTTAAEKSDDHLHQAFSRFEPVKESKAEPFK